jgi:Outer membrane protein beta-barrel domain
MKNFEQHIRDRFDGREVQVDKNELWANIAPQLESPKKERKIWFFFLLGIATGATLLGLYFFIQQDSTPSTLVITATTIAEQQKAITKSSHEQTPQTSQEDASETTPSNNTTTSRQLPAITEAAKNNQLQQTYASKPKSSVFANHNTTSTTQAKETTAFFQTSNNPVPTTDRVETANNSNQAISTETTITTEAIPTLSSLSKAAIPSLDLSPFTSSFDYTKKVAENTSEVLITPQQSKSRIGLGLYGGLSATQTLRKERATTDFVYTQLRGSTEDPLPAFHLGLQAVFEINKNIYIQSGLEYSQLRSRLNLKDEKILIDPNTYEITRGIGITDTSVFIPDNVIVAEVAQNKTISHIHLMDLPVFVGYQFGQTRWRVGLEAGAFINLSLQKDGEILQEDISIYDLKEDNNGWYKSNVGIRPHLGLVTTCNLTKHYQLYFSTGMTFNKVFTTDRSPVQEEKSLFGVRMGGRYFF